MTEGSSPPATPAPVRLLLAGSESWWDAVEGIDSSLVTVVGTSDDVEQALHMAESLEPDVVVLERGSLDAAARVSAHASVAVISAGEGIEHLASPERRRPLHDLVTAVVLVASARPPTLEAQRAARSGGYSTFG